MKNFNEFINEGFFKAHPNSEFGPNVTGLTHDLNNFFN